MTTDFDNTDDREEAADLPESDALDSTDAPGENDADGDDASVADDSLDIPELPELPSEPSDESSLTSTFAMVGVVVLTFSMALNASLLIWRPKQVITQSVDNGDTTAVDNGDNGNEPDAAAAVIRRTRYRDGDNFVGEGSYNEAIRRYMEIGTDKRGDMPLRLLYRLGLCHEELGLFDDALSFYRQIITDRKVPVKYQWLSRVSQARVWLRARSPEQARAMLAGCVLGSDREGVSEHPVAAEAMYLYALASARIDTANDDPDPSEPWVVPSPSHWPVQSVLTWSDNKPVKEGPSLRAERTIVTIPEPDESTPLFKRVKLEGENVNVQALLEEVGTQTGHPVEFHPVAQAMLDGHVTEAVTSRVPASIVLTALTEPYDLTWEVVGGTLVVGPRESEAAVVDPEDPNAIVVQTPNRIARESLATALAMYPGHRLAVAARLEYGNVHFKEADYTNATLYYKDLVSTRSDPQTMAAAFNLGLAHRRMGNLGVSRNSLLLVVDGIPEHPLSAVASYLVGRMLLDEGNYADAVSPLDAAARARIDDRSRSAAAVYAAIAHLLQDNYHQAGAVLFANRTGLADENELRDAAAFLNSYTRYLTLSDNRDEQRQETVYLFRSLFALGPAPTWMGSYGMLLVGRAYRDLGMHARMTDIFNAARDEAQGIILAEMEFWIARQEFETPELFLEKDPTELTDAQRRQQLDTISGRGLTSLQRLVTLEGSNEWGQAAMLKLAQIELDENRADECIQLCRRLLSIEDAQVFDVLRLMGQAYEFKGDAKAAAFCFAGQIPPA